MRQHWVLAASVASGLLVACAIPSFADGANASAVPSAPASSAPGASASPASTSAGQDGDGIGVSIATGDNNPFADVPRGSFAYQAIVRLHALGYLQGYPDELFHGKRDLTRYEMAVMVDRVVSELEYELKNPNGALKVTQAAISDARALLDEYGGEIKDLQAKETALEARMTTAESTLNRMQIHAYAYVRAPGNYSETVSAFAPNGTPLPDGTNVKDDAQTYVVGTHMRGTGYSVFRLILQGDLDKQAGYAVRLENKNYFGQANVNGLDNVNPAGPTVSTYNTGGLLRLNYAYLRYSFTNSPIYVWAGKYTLRSDPLGLAYDNDYYNGGLIGFKEPKLYGWLGFGQTGGPDLGSTAPFTYVNGPASGGAVANTQFALLAHVGYTPTSRLLLTGSYVELQGYNNMFWDNLLGKYVPLQANLAVGSVGASYQFNPVIYAAVQGLTRFGNDPTTGAAWTDPNAIWGLVNIGHAAAKLNNNFMELGFVGTGAHSVLNAETWVNGTPFYTFYYTGQANDRRMVYFGVHHWVSNFMRMGINYQAWGLNTPIPLFSAKGVPAGSYMMNNDNRALFLNSFMQF